MNGIQVTRDSVEGDDALGSPHVMMARISAAPTVAEVVEWVVSHHYLAGLPTDDVWALRLESRAGEVAARFITRVTDVPRVEMVSDPAQSLRGVGCVHLERRPVPAEHSHQED